MKTTQSNRENKFAIARRDFILKQYNHCNNCGFESDSQELLENEGFCKICYKQFEHGVELLRKQYGQSFK